MAPISSGNTITPDQPTFSALLDRWKSARAENLPEALTQGKHIHRLDLLNLALARCTHLVNASLP
jgi:hypothetical protein